MEYTSIDERLREIQYIVAGGMVPMIIHIIKRDGRKVPFNIEKIANAIFRAAQTQGGTDFNTAHVHVR